MTQPLTDAITALTRYANEVTGQSDTNLSDAVWTLCDGYGGGGATPFELLEEITLTEAVRAVNYDASKWTDYDLLIISCDVTLSAEDWVYTAVNGTSSLNYTDKLSTWNGIAFVYAKKYRLGNGAWVPTASIGALTNATTLQNVYWYCYDANKKFNIGSSFKVWGAKYADL